jgi:hypothetical protein
VTAFNTTSWTPAQMAKCVQHYCVIDVIKEARVTRTHMQPMVIRWDCRSLVVTVKVAGAPTDPPPMPGPAAEHLEGLTGPGRTEASSLESGEAGSSGDGEAGSVSFLSLSDTAARALKVALKADLVAAVVSASDLSLMVMSAFMGFWSLL